MADSQDRVDIPNVAGRGEGKGPSSHTAVSGGKRWLGILFNCCHVYGRIYKDDANRRYRGRCPSCGTPIDVPVGPKGTSQRFFETTR
jgi:hypothetical protein